MFKLFVVECSSCFNEKVMQVKQGRVVADGGFRHHLTEERNGPKFSTSWVMIEDKGNVVPSLFTLSNAVLLEPESTLLLAGASWIFWADTSVGMDLDGPGEGRDIPRHGGQQNFRLSSDDFVRERETQLCRHVSGMALYFPQISQFS